jgi:hypothetical protein
VRVYLPTTMGGLRTALADGSLDAPTGYAVTPALREWYVEGDLEELEYAATSAAARASLRLVGDGVPRRVVLAAELPDGRVHPTGTPGGEDRATVRVDGPVDLALVESALVDHPGAADDVRAAVAALPGADAGDDDATFVVDGVEDHELGWYAAQELAVLVELES